MERASEMVSFLQFRTFMSVRCHLICLLPGYSVYTIFTSSHQFRVKSETVIVTQLHPGRDPATTPSQEQMKERKQTREGDLLTSLEGLKKEKSMTELSSNRPQNGPEQMDPSPTKWNLKSLPRPYAFVTRTREVSRWCDCSQQTGRRRGCLLRSGSHSRSSFQSLTL